MFLVFDEGILVLVIEVQVDVGLVVGQSGYQKEYQLVGEFSRMRWYHSDLSDKY